MIDDSSLYLYMGKNLYKKPESEPKKMVINLLLIPLIVYAITQIFRKKLSVNEFYRKQKHNINKIKKNIKKNCQNIKIA